MDEADRAAIRRCTVALVEDMEPAAVLDHLFQRGTITRAQHEELMPNSKTERRQKVRDFLGVISRRGPSAFNDLCDALLDTDQAHLVKLLSPEKAVARAQPKSDPEQCNVSTAETKPSTEQFITTPVKEVTPDKLSMYWQLVRDNKAYKMTKTRGRVLVINNENFTKARDRGKVLKDRDGTVNDAMNLNSLFDSLDFDYHINSDQTANEMQQTIKSETECEEHSTFGMFVLVILSHGENGAIYGVDGELLQITTIKKLLGSRSFHRMKDKPKLILLQACQGEQHDGQIVGDGPEADAAPPTETAPRAEFADMLIAFPTASGNVSYRDPNLGTWFIRAVADVFRRDAWEDHVVDMLTKVRQQVHAVSVAHNLVQGTFDENHLHKKLYLIPGWSGN